MIHTTKAWLLMDILKTAFLLSASCMLAIAQPGKSATETIWHITQKCSTVGKIELYVGKKIVKAALTDSGYTFYFQPAKNEAVVYNERTHFGIKKMMQTWHPSLTNRMAFMFGDELNGRAWAVKTKVTKFALPIVEYRTPSTERKKAQDYILTTDAISVSKETIRLLWEICAGTAIAETLPRSLPIEFCYLDSEQGMQTVLKTYECKRLSAQTELSMPKFNEAADESTVYLMKKNVDDLF